MPLFGKFVTPIVELATKHPGIAIATGITAALVPAQMSDENRGYFRTAAITTPIIGALGAAAPGLVTSASRLHRAGDAFVRRMPYFFKRDSQLQYKEVRDFLDGGSIDLGNMNPALKNWVDQSAIDFFSVTTEPVGKDIKASFKTFEELIKDPTKKSLLTYAVQGAHLRSATPTQLAGETQLTTLPIVPDDQLFAMIEAGKNNPRFVDEFNRRMRWATNLTDAGKVSIAADVMEKPALKELSFHEGFDLLSAQRPEVADAIRSALWNKTVESAVVVAEQTVKGETGKLLGIRLKRSNGELKELTIPIFDPNTGTVRLGKQFESIGVGRRIYDGEKVSQLDIFASQHLHHEWKLLKEDIKRAGYFGGVDPLNPFKMATHTESQLSILSPQALHLRSRSAIPSSLPVFGGKSFSELTATDKLGILHRMLTNGMTRIGSEGGTAKGVYEYASSELFTVGGMPSLAKQSSFYRSFSKELQLDANSIPSTWRPRVTTTAVETIGGVPEVRMSVAGISPQMKSLFGDLPDDLAKLPTYRETAIKRIMADSGISREAAEAAWTKIEGTIAQKGSLQDLRKIGGLGEGGILIHEKYSNMGMESRTTVRVNELHIGTEKFKTQPFGPDQLIGFSGLEPGTASAPENFIEKAERVGDHVELTLRQKYPIETGAKVDVGVKGLAIVATDTELSNIRDTMNLYGELTNTKTAIPSYVDAIAPLHYTQAKVSDPFRLILEQAAEVSEHLSNVNISLGSVNALDELNKYMSDLNAQGIKAHWGDHLSFVEDSQALLDRGYRSERIQYLTERTQKYLDSIGDLALREAPGTQDELFEAFRQSKSTNLLDFMQRNAMSAPAAFWDSTRRNVSHSVATTFDLFSEMFRSGHIGGIKDILSRLQFQGDPSEAATFAHHFVSGDFTKPMGNVIDIGSAMGGRVDTALRTMKDRAGTIFDPTRTDIQENFSLKLKEPVWARVGGVDMEVTHIPVLGKAAYGGGSNLYEEPGEGLAYSTTEYEKSLAGVIRASNQNQASLGKAISEHFENTYSVLFGKDGFYRARGVDPMALSGFLQTRAVPDNPFEALIPKQMVSRIRDEGIRTALEAGQDVYATVARHPIQTSPYMRIKVAPDAGLGPNMIGMDERIRAIFGADDDKDMLNLFFYRKGSQGEREALAAINTLDSNQWKSLKTLEMLYGAKEDSRNISQVGLKSLPEMVDELVTSAGTLEGRELQVARRTAGQAIGAYSNLLSRLQVNLEMHPTISRNPEARALLGHLFWPIRQVPISAQKGQMKLNPEDPLSLWKKISASMNDRSETGVNTFMEGIEEVLGGFIDPKKLPPLTEETAKTYNELTGARAVAGDRVNTIMDVWRAPKTKELVTDFLMNRNVAADKAAGLITREVDTMAEDSLYSLSAMYKEMQGAYSYLQGMVGEGSKLGYRHAAAETLGAINDFIKGAKGSVREALPTLALGAGLAVAGSFLTNNIKKHRDGAGAVFSRGTGKFRPEETTTVSDHVPGEPMAGQMSSVNPPRRQLPARTGTNTAIVAPMHQRSDLEVTMKAQDRRDTAEVQRLVSQVGGRSGVSNVNINYRNGWRNKVSTLRQREIIKEQLDES